MVEKVAEYGTRKTIMIGQDSYYLALGCKVSGSANGIIKAGQPLVGDLKARDTAFTAGTSGAVGMNLHDVKLDSTGKGNATLVIRGCVDGLKIDADMLSALNTAAIDGIVIVKGSAI